MSISSCRLFLHRARSFQHSNTQAFHVQQHVGTLARCVVESSLDLAGVALQRFSWEFHAAGAATSVEHMRPMVVLASSAGLDHMLSAS